MYALHLASLNILHNQSENIETFYLFKSIFFFYFEEYFKVLLMWILYILVQFIAKYLIFLVDAVNGFFLLPLCPSTDCLSLNTIEFCMLILYATTL